MRHPHRDLLWRWLRRNVPDGEILPRRLLFAGYLLHPSFLLIHLAEKVIGIEWDYARLQIIVNGVRFDLLALRRMADAEPGTTFRVAYRTLYPGDKRSTPAWEVTEPTR